MKKLQTAIRYECSTSIRYIWIFYTIMLSIVAVVIITLKLCLGNNENINMSALENSSIIYIGVVGIMGFTEDFKMLIQNGFTRKYIFISTITMFMFMSAFLALLDTVIASVIPLIIPDYRNIFGFIYGYKNQYILNWLLLFLTYTLVSCITYFFVVLYNKIGKIFFIAFMVALGITLCFIVPLLFVYVIPENVIHNILTFLTRIAGFTADGKINYLYPIVSMIIASGIFGGIAYLILRRTELKT